MASREAHSAGGYDVAHIAALEATVDRLEQELAQSRSQLNLAADARRSNAEELAGLRNELSALKRRRSIRLAIAVRDQVGVAYRAILRIAGLARRGVRAAPRRIIRRARQRSLRASSAEEAELVAMLRAQLPGTATERGPLVSIIILNRDGREHLQQCLGALATTAYRDVEVIVIDNGSTDGSPEVAESFELPFPIRVIRNETNRSFSEANNQAVAIALGPLLCFLNNDVDPITGDWLGYMVDTMRTRQAVAVGARLIYPKHRGGPRAGSSLSDLSLQHAGVDFDRGKGVPLARVLGAGEDAMAPWAGNVEDRPALTGACLLVRQDAFREVGGFSPAYDYGFEDVDLCIKLQIAGGRLVYDGRAALWHHESATRASDRAGYSARSATNRETFAALWGPRIFRAALLDALHGGRRYSNDPFHVAITLTGETPAAGPQDRSSGTALGAALAAHGWRVSYLASSGEGWEAPDPSVEAVLVLHDAFDIRRLPRNIVTMASIEDPPEAWLDRVWFDDFDLVLAPTDEVAGTVRQRSAKVARLTPTATDDALSAASGAYASLASVIREALISWASVTRYGLRIGVPSWEVIDRWGDYHFARGLQRSLERAGHPTRVHFLPDWGSPSAARDDVAVHLFGLKEAPTHPGQVNILWQISHPDLASPEIYGRYDHVFVASDSFATRMAERVTVPVTPLHQATDPERFRPMPGGPHHELLFVANSRKVHRRIVDDLAGTTHDLAIYGRDWTPDLVDSRFVKGEVVLNTELARYYSAADLVLNDHWDDMRIEGFLSNRLYDALACGAFVISDFVDGIEAEFGGAVATYGTTAELEPLITRYLDHPDERQRLAARGREIVLQRHTFDQRVEALCEVTESLALARPLGIEVAAPSSLTAEGSKLGLSDAAGDPVVAA